MAIIVDFEEHYHEDFKKLNLEWLDKFNLTEGHDLEILNHPWEVVIDKGGFIFILIEYGIVAGTAGIFKINDEEFEVIKMTVAPEYRGKNFGALLLEKCIEKAIAQGASKLILFSNSKLYTAIRLYEKYGFKHIDVTGAPFKTADIKMELVLQP